MRSAGKVLAAVLCLSGLAAAACGARPSPAALHTAPAEGALTAPLADAPGTPPFSGALPGAPGSAAAHRSQAGAPAPVAAAAPAPTRPAVRTVSIPGDVPVTLTVPAAWTLHGTVFLDGARKVAELSPGAAVMPGPDACRNWPGPDPAEDPTQILQQSPVAFGALHGLRRVEEAPLEDGPATGIWYPVAYCLQDGDKGLYITFYAPNAHPATRAAFDGIAASAAFPAEI